MHWESLKEKKKAAWRLFEKNKGKTCQFDARYKGTVSRSSMDSKQGEVKRDAPRHCDQTNQS